MRSQCMEMGAFVGSSIKPVLTELGFSDIEYGVLDVNGPAGSAFFLLASRPEES